MSCPKEPKSLSVLRVPLLLAAMGGLALAIDLPMAKWCLDGGMPTSVAKLLRLAEVFGHGIGVFAIVLTAAILDPTRRWAVPRLVLASLGAGLAANLGKLIVARVRPHHFDFAGDVASSFIGWLPMGSGPSFEQGCPSAHAATAAGLAVGLSWLYPRGRYLFATLATLVAMQRIESGAHFVSDALWGAAIGMTISQIATQLPSLGYLGDKLENALRLSPTEIDSAETRLRDAA